MRPLTAQEKKQIADVKKRANTAISKKRILLGAQIRACTAPVQMQRKKELLLQFDALSPVKGYPAVIKDKDRSMIIDYQLLRRVTRSLKHRCVDIRLDPGGLLTIQHEDPTNSRNRGELELYEIPPWQQCALTDLPVIEID
ncbi:hypothetical protein [Paenibacillus illinoisensis]|uniref:hypothetical protein n=1 Tax=Paenibacillus illinoisensis TaxID=59845 RepID=UPI000FD6C4CC|nr:hypothetical protein [Paenibacillus illinoisensis]